MARPRPRLSGSMGCTAQALIGDDATSHNIIEPSATSDMAETRTSGMMEPSYQNSSIDASGDGEKTPADRRRACPWGKLLVGAVLLGVVIYVIVDATTTKNIQRGFQIFLEWIEDNILAGVFAFMGVYFVATVCFVPGSILTLGSGFVFGKAVGLGPGVALATAAVFVGASLGAIASFLLGRYLLRDWVGRKLVEKYSIVKALDEALKQNGLKIFLLLRLSPIIPFNAINYIGGVTSVQLNHYSLALIGILPGTVLYVFIGATAGSLTESENAVSGPWAIAAIVIGIVFGLLAVFAASYYAKREFNKIVAEQEERDQDEEGFAAEDQPEADEMA
ncbi:hypothetical protein ACHAXT_012178 [Thalassiosira profunda]